ncbi:SIMPL domain-containing protein [Alicyclobacillus hesperidum]|uniref:SIMPL domain-containing protein n=1 Tax=Alicyclobacillus hesperidum TaxID=89784 RepID=UPI0002F18ECF|nr:SIMPL domain-containing protein [Alicyclobacillus hesperidum]
MEKWVRSLRGRTRGGWRFRSLVTVGTAMTLMFTLAETTWAMGAAQNNTGTLNVLAANTITVEGVATEPILNPVTEINESMTITDSSVQAEFKDIGTLEQHMRSALKKDGIVNGNIWFSTPSFTSGNSGTQVNLQVNVIVPKASQLSNVLTSLGSYDPNFVQNNFMNEQVVPLNPSAMWPQLYQEALNNAKSQAETLASEAGVQLGQVEAISTVQPSGVLQPLSGPYPTSPSVPGLQLVYNNGTQAGEVMTQLYVTFAINPS